MIVDILHTNQYKKHSMLTRSDIDTIKSFGFRVFQRAGGETYAYFTDGKNIGYIQSDSLGYKLSTVHKANCKTGTGYGLDPIDTLTEEKLRGAFAFAPAWAYNSRTSAVKYPSLESFLKINNWGGGLHEV